MKRSTLIALAAMLAIAAGTILAGCGSGDERTPIPRSRLSTPSRAELSPEEQKLHDQRQAERLASVMSWPEESGPPRDVLADQAACQQQLQADREYSTANPLVQLTWLTRCMTNKGWQLDPDARQKLAEAQ